MNYLKVYYRQIAANVSIEIAYKFNFFTRFFIIAISNLITPIIGLLLYQSTPGIPGWRYEEFILFLGTYSIVMGLGHVFTDGIAWEVIEHIKKGNFDSVLSKPMPPLLFMTSKSFHLPSLSELIVGIVLVGWATNALHIGFSRFWIAYMLLILVGFLFHYSVIILISSLAFLFVNSDSLFRIYWRLTDFARYPQHIYHPRIQFFLTFIFPLGIVSFFPAQTLIKGTTLTGLLSIILPVILFFMICLGFWSLAMKKYTSAGG